MMEIGNGRSSELHTLPYLPPEKVKNLKEVNLYDFYKRSILRAENILYGKDRNTRVYKLVFLVAGPQNDVTQEQDENGRSIYLENPSFPKVPEIPEATAALSKYFVSILDRKPNLAQIETNRIEAMSELADIFHNLVELTILDPDYEQPYKTCIKQLSDSLSSPEKPFKINDGITLAYVKYYERLINAQIKSPQDESTIIKQALEIDKSGKALITTSTDLGLKRAFGTINEISEDVLKDRLKFIRKHPDWGGKSKS